MSTRNRNRCAFVLSAALSVLPDTATALTQIEVTSWGRYTADFRGVPCVFVGRVTDRDIQEGVRFSLHESDGSATEILTDIALPWTPPYPPVGSEVRLFAVLTLQCLPGGGVRGGAIRGWTVTWCIPPEATQSRYDESTPPLAAFNAGAETHEFVLVDENGVVAAAASPEDFFSCSASASGFAPPAALWPPSPADRLASGKLFTDPSFASGSPFEAATPGVTAEPTGSIGVYLDPAGTVACGDVPPVPGFYAYVVMRTAGATECGIAGAELRLTGFPPSWLVSANAPPNAIVLGNVFGGGATMGFTSCQSGAPGSVLLFTLAMLVGDPVSDLEIQVLPRTPSPNPLFPCPLVTLCDPFFIIVCVEGRSMTLNPAPGSECDIPIGVQRVTWSRIKRMYD